MRRTPRSVIPASSSAAAAYGAMPSPNKATDPIKKPRRRMLVDFIIAFPLFHFTRPFAHQDAAQGHY
jgi:hypothetical protein